MKLIVKVFWQGQTRRGIKKSGQALSDWRDRESFWWKGRGCERGDL